VSVAEFVTRVDRLLTRAHGLFPAGGGDAGGVFAAGGGGSVPARPAGASGLDVGAGVARGFYQHAQSGLVGLDADSGRAAAGGGAVGQAGRAGSGVVRDQARAQAATLAPMTNSAAGMRLVVAAMDERLAAMQQQLDTTSAQNQELATRLRKAAAAYRGLADLPGTPGGDQGTDARLDHGSPRLGVQAVDFKQNPPPPAPPLPPPRPPTGEPIKLPSPTTPGPVTVITAKVDPNGPDDPQKHRCGPAEIGKDTTIAVGGALGIATGIAGEIPTLGAATAAIVAGAGALWDGMDKLGECK
jgi:hypothetical protein